MLLRKLSLGSFVFVGMWVCLHEPRWYTFGLYSLDATVCPLFLCKVSL